MPSKPKPPKVRPEQRTKSPDDPDVTLDKPQKKMTRQERRAKNKRIARVRNRRMLAEERAKAPKCKGKTLKGTKCRSFAIPDNDGFCSMHGPRAAEIKAKAADGNRIARAILRQKQPKPHELMRQVIESNPMLFMKPHLEALGITVEFIEDPENPELVKPVAIPHGDGAVLYGVSKDGDVVISTHKDIEAQQKAAERLMDRVYGKPKQTNIVVGPHDDEAKPPELVPFDKQRQEDIARILADATGRPQATPTVPMNGDGNGNGNGNGTNGGSHN